jgi:threonine dehydratase
MNIPTLQDIHAAAERLSGRAFATPLLRFPVLDEHVGGTILVKAENLQRTGSFKFRGAYNRISSIDPERRSAGVVTCSSGNHAQGVAEAARLFGIPATVVMPDDAPRIKQQRTRASGAKILLYERGRQDREAIARRIQEQTGATFIHPYDDPGIIAGQGTVGLELARQAQSEGYQLDATIVCAGGGGLTAGISIALGSLVPSCRIYTAEPAEFDDHARSFATGVRQSNSAAGGSICDALLAATPGELTFRINKARVECGLVVDDREAMDAVAFAARELKLILEPGGAVALAAVLSGRIDVKGKTVAVIASGGNIDPSVLLRAMAEG